VVYSPDGKYFVTGSEYSANIKIWDSFNYNLIKKLEGHINGITSIDISPDGK